MSGLNLILVIDGSYSMREGVSYRAADGAASTELAYSRKQMVHFAATVLTKALDMRNDTVSVVVYSEKAKVLLNKRLPSEQAVRDALANPGVAESNTRMDLGLAAASECLSDAKRNEVILMTDGVENAGSDSIRFLETHPLNWRVHTVAFGMSDPDSMYPQLDPQRLLKMATMTNGAFGYAADISMIGTVFNYLLAQIIAPPPPPPAEAVDAGTALIDVTTKSPTVAGVTARMERFKATVPQIELDLDHQVYPAFEPRAYRKWGECYALSYGRTLQLGWCNNFKDKAPAEFVTDAVRAEYERLSAIYDTTELPKPTGSTRGATLASSAAINRVDNGCIHAESLIDIPGGQIRAIDVIPGTVVLTSDNKEAVVTDAVRQETSGYLSMVALTDTLTVTPYHPVRAGTQWVFPSDLKTPTKTRATSVYSFALDTPGAVLKAGEYAVASLGHGLEDDVIRHPFFGTDAWKQQLPTNRQYHQFGTKALVRKDGLVAAWNMDAYLS